MCPSDPVWEVHWRMSTLVPEVSLVGLVSLNWSVLIIQPQSDKEKLQAKKKPLAATVYNLTSMQSNSDF